MIRFHPVFFFLVLFLSACSYLPEDLDKVNYDVIKEETGDYILISSSDILPDNAFLFVPGGFVDPHVYLCWMTELVNRYPEIAIIQIKVPSNLAIVNMGKVGKVMSHFSEIQHWTIGGHSLGGVVSVFALSDKPDSFDGLVLMASWATESKSLAEWDGNVLSIYASNDGLATTEEIAANKQYLPEAVELTAADSIVLSSNQTCYYRINGGNHSGFGCYGFQEGDNDADISREEQQEEMISLMIKYFDALWE